MSAGKFYSKLARWLDGEDIAATRNYLRFEGDVFWHKNEGTPQIIRSPGRAYLLGRGLSDGLSPSMFNGWAAVFAARKGQWQDPNTYGYVTTTTPQGLEQRSYQVIRNGKLHTWSVPQVELVLCPAILMSLGTFDRRTVDLGTKAEHARVQRVIMSRSKTLREDGTLPHFLRYLTANAEAFADYDSSYGQYGLADLNHLRSLFDLEPMEPFDSPIPGLKLKDLSNLASLA